MAPQCHTPTGTQVSLTIMAQKVKTVSQCMATVANGMMSTAHAQSYTSSVSISPSKLERSTVPNPIASLKPTVTKSCLAEQTSTPEKDNTTSLPILGSSSIASQPSKLLLTGKISAGATRREPS